MDRGRSLLGRQELDFNGVHLLRSTGELIVLTKEMSFPNGIALSPDEKLLDVANSDLARPVWMVFDIKADGTIEGGRVFFDASELARRRGGLPDGLEVDSEGNLFATGPGGVLVISAGGTHLGTILTGVLAANCAWGEDGSALYITADRFLCRIRLTTRGKVHPRACRLPSFRDAERRRGPPAGMFAHGSRPFP